MSEFKVGDKVRITSETGGGYGEVCKGVVGEVEEVTGDGSYPHGYEVRFFHPGYRQQLTLYFFSHEIERVAPEVTPGYGPPQVGDYIKATHKDDPKRTVTGKVTSDLVSWIVTEDATLVRSNWDFEVLDRPEPEPEPKYELPTEPGLYTTADRSEDEDYLASYRVYSLDRHGDWYYDGKPDDMELACKQKWKLRKLGFARDNA